MNSTIHNICRRCYMENKVLKQFFAANNMNPSDIPDKLKGLTEIEKMLIT